jgi:predicted GTPase
LKSKEEPSVEEVAADPAGYFSEAQQREMAKLGHANILISGQTGAGKSTLINAVFRVPLADVGVGSRSPSPCSGTTSPACP